MTDPESDRGGEYVSVQIPAALRERIDAVFRTYRGYEPSTAQESLSLVCDLAEGRIDADGDGRPVDHSRDRAATGDRDAVGRTLPSLDADGRSLDRKRTRNDPDERDFTPDPSPAEKRDVTRETVDIIEEVFPCDWDVDPTVEEYLPVVVERYVENPEGLDDEAERERDAVAAAAREADADPETLQRSLVTSLYGGAGFPDGLAGEFFAEALAEAAEIASRPPVETTAEAASDGGVADRSGGSIDSLLADADAEPTADCECCDSDHPVDDLETVIGPEDGSTVRLLCPDCAADVQ